MTKSDIFRHAHALARAGTGDYSLRLSLALEVVYSEIKKQKITII